MSVTVSYGSLLSFLDTQLDCDPPAPTAEPTGLCILAGGIVGRNLEDALARRKIPTEGFAVSTIEDTAREVLDAHHRRHTEDPDSVTVLDDQLCEHLLVDSITTASKSEPLADVADLLSGFDLAGRPALRERLWSELDRYFRMTDAGADHAAAVDVAVDLAASDPYAASRSQQALRAFRTLHTALKRRTDGLAETAYLSRSHLVAAAREQLAAEWRACYPSVEWVAVDTISVLDNPTLRFFEALATLEGGPDIYVFGTAAGAGPTIGSRLESAGLDVDVIDDDGDDRPHVSALIETVEGNPPETVPNVEFVEAPDQRRELAYVAGQIRALTEMGGGDRYGTAASTPGEIVVAAKDVIGYRSRIADVFTDHSIPHHIEARQPLMQTVGYRYLRAVFDLLAAAADTAPVATQELVDPLRLGFCPPETPPEWPLDGDTVTEIEDRLDAVGPSTDDGQPFDDWIETVRTEFGRDETPIRTFIEWVDETAANPPQSADSVVDLIDTLLDAHLAARTRSGIQQPRGPGVDGTRVALSTTHETHGGRRLQDHADRVGSYIEQAIVTDLTDLGEAGWELAATAFKSVCGSGSYWPPNNDGNAVRVVNAANAHFVEADYVFVVGLAAEEFPAQRTPPAFFHDTFYKSVRETAHNTASGHAAAYLHAPTNDAQFEGDTDEFRAAIAAASEGVWCCRRYKTREGEPTSWSGFVDAYTARVDEAIHRIAADQWLPKPDTTESWESASTAATPRDRLRMLSAAFPDGVDSEETGSNRPHVDRAGLVDLLSRADGDAYNREIEPRRRRYFGADCQSIRVRPDEPMGSTSRSLDELVGEPTRLYELDLYTTCQLKYYYYQYLNGGGDHRDRISRLPTVLSERYPPSEFISGLRRLLSSSDRLADRQAAFGRDDSLGAFRDRLVSWIEADPALSEAVIQPMLGEYLAVEQERAAGLSRQWRWEPATTVRIDGHAVSVPGHRVDYIPKYDFSIPVWYTAADGVAEALVRQSLTPTNGDVRDHRLLVGTETVDTVGGILVCDPTSAAASARRGFLIGDLNPIPEAVPQESNLRKLSRADWRETSIRWREAAASNLEAMTTTDEPITYRVSESFVDNGGCVGCEYRGLCRVPMGRREGQ